jgi:SnoaL-like domain
MDGNRELAERFIATLEARDWDAWAGLLHPAVVYEIPQSRERIRGRDRYLRFNQEYPGDWHLRPKVTIADERHGVVWFEWLLDGRTDDAMAFFEFAGGLITRVTDFWPEPYEPPPGREHLVERWLSTSAQRGVLEAPGHVGVGGAGQDSVDPHAPSVGPGYQDCLVGNCRHDDDLLFLPRGGAASWRVRVSPRRLPRARVAGRPRRRGPVRCAG